MKKLNTGSIIKRFICYVLGLFLIAIGINISKLSALGMSAVSSIPRAIEIQWPRFTLGNTTLIVYCVLIALQLAVLGKKFKWTNLLGFLLTFAFSFIVDLVGIDPKATGHIMYRLGLNTRPDAYLLKLAFMLISIVFIGIGVFLYLRPKWIPMPAEGLAGAISERTGKKFGDCKTIVDCSMIFIALVIQLIFMGGFKSFTRPDVVVREGTVLAAVLVGQIVKLLAKYLAKPIDKWFGPAIKK